MPHYAANVFGIAELAEEIGWYLDNKSFAYATRSIRAFTQFGQSKRLCHNQIEKRGLKDHNAIHSRKVDPRLIYHSLRRSINAILGKGQPIFNTNLCAVDDTLAKYSQGTTRDVILSLNPVMTLLFRQLPNDTHQEIYSLTDGKLHLLHSNRRLMLLGKLYANGYYCMGYEQDHMKDEKYRLMIRKVQDWSLVKCLEHGVEISANLHLEWIAHGNHVIRLRRDESTIEVFNSEGNDPHELKHIGVRQCLGTRNKTFFTYSYENVKAWDLDNYICLSTVEFDGDLNIEQAGIEDLFYFDNWFEFSDGTQVWIHGNRVKIMSPDEDDQGIFTVDGMVQIIPFLDRFIVIATKSDLFIRSKTWVELFRCSVDIEGMCVKNLVYDEFGRFVLFYHEDDDDSTINQFKIIDFGSSEGFRGEILFTNGFYDRNQYNKG